MVHSSSRPIGGAQELPYHNPIDTRQVRATAAVVRLGAIEAQLLLASTYCAMAEADVDRGRADKAGTILHRARRIGKSVRRHVNEPNYVPAMALAEIRSHLEVLERRVISVAVRLTH